MFQKTTPQSAPDEGLALRSLLDRLKSHIHLLKESACGADCSFLIPDEGGCNLCLRSLANPEGPHLPEALAEPVPNAGPGLPVLRVRIGLGLALIQFGREGGRNRRLDLRVQTRPEPPNEIDALGRGQIVDDNRVCHTH